jgi:hypothetical protein
MEQKSQSDYFDLVDEIDNYLTISLRYQSALVDDQIQPGIKRIFLSHVHNAREGLVDEQLSFLGQYFQGVCLAPREHINYFPIREGYLDELLRDLKRIEGKPLAKAYLHDHQFTWALRMLAGWVNTASQGWDFVLERFIMEETDVVLFLQCMFDYLTSLPQNIDLYLLHSPHLVKLEFDSNGNALSTGFISLLSQLETRINSSQGRGAERNLIEIDLLDKVAVMQSFGGVRSTNARKINRQLAMYYASIDVALMHRGCVRDVTVSKPILLLSEALKACRRMNYFHAVTGEFLHHQLTLRADTVLYIDCDLTNSAFHGINLVVHATRLVVVCTAGSSTEVTIDLSGVDGIKPVKPDNPGRKEGSLEGLPGVDGEHGEQQE